VAHAKYTVFRVGRRERQLSTRAFSNVVTWSMPDELKEGRAFGVLRIAATD